MASDVRGDLAYSVGHDTAELSVDAAPIALWRLRVSHVYRRKDDGWKIVHRHADSRPTLAANGWVPRVVPASSRMVDMDAARPAG